jgi:hypothetical protein
MGRLKSSSWKPTARNMARLGARPIPSVVSKLLRRSPGMVVSCLMGGKGIVSHYAANSGNQ